MGAYFPQCDLLLVCKSSFVLQYIGLQEVSLFQMKKQWIKVKVTYKSMQHSFILRCTHTHTHTHTHTPYLMTLANLVKEICSLEVFLLNEVKVKAHISYLVILVKEIYSRQALGSCFCNWSLRSRSHWSITLNRHYRLYLAPLTPTQNSFSTTITSWPKIKMCFSGFEHMLAYTEMRQHSVADRLAKEGSRQPQPNPPVQGSGNVEISISP